jgi:prevent-host-death family protein
MSVVSIAEAKDSLPALVTAAQAGETITITRHGRPVAQISAAAAETTCAPQSIDWIEAQLAMLPRTLSDPATLLRKLRDDG